MEFLIWILGMIIGYYIIKWLGDGQGSAGVGIAILVWGGWSALMIVITVARVLMKVFDIHGIKLY